MLHSVKKMGCMQEYIGEKVFPNIFSWEAGLLHSSNLFLACCEESPCATKGSKLFPPGAGGDCHSKSEGSADRNPSLRDGHEVGEQPFLDDFREFLKIWSMAAPFLR